MVNSGRKDSDYFTLSEKELSTLDKLNNNVLSDLDYEWLLNYVKQRLLDKKGMHDYIISLENNGCRNII